MLLRDLTPDLLLPRSALLSDDVALMALPGTEGPMPARPGMLPPYGTVAVDGPGGAHRIAAMRIGAGAAVFDLAALGGDVSDLAALGGDVADLAAELDLPSRRRLLGFLLGFCRTAFGLGTDAGFAGICRGLAQDCAADAGTAQAIATATPSWMVLGGVDLPENAVVYVLGTTRVRYGATLPVPGSAIRLIEPMEDGETLLAMATEPAMWTVRRPPLLPNVLGPNVLGPNVLGPNVLGPNVLGPNALGPAGRTAVHAALRTACLRALATVGGPTAALLRETQVLTPAAARRHDDPSAPLGLALEAVLPDGEGGLFLRGWIRDPLGLVAGVEIRTPLATAAIEGRQLHRFRRPDLQARFARAAFRDADARPGFVLHAPDPSGHLCLQPSLVLRLQSGNVIGATAPLRHLPPSAARDAVLSSVPPEEVTPDMLDGCLAPAAAALHRQAMRARGVPDVIRIGAPVRQPAVSILVPLYRNLGFLRFQMAAFAADAECRRAELIFVLDSPEQRIEAEHLLRGLYALHGLPCTVVVMATNAGYAAANNAAAAVARGPALLLLNSDVVPARPGWLAAMRAALTAGVGAAGPKLLFDDGSIQHAGLFFERDGEGVWFNAHYHKGMPRHWPAAQKRRRVPGVTGAALLVRRNLFEAVGGICEDYIIGDYEDSDFCLRLRAAGAAIAYVPEAELFHFERRSIRLHAGYSNTLACLYNRRLHHRRWNDTIAALMARREHRNAA